MKYKNVIPAFLNLNLIDDNVIMFRMSSLHDVTENCFYPEPIRELLRVRINFIFPLEDVTGLNAF